MRPFLLLDVFTDRPLEGNGLAVFLDADDVDDATMHRAAREMRLSETSFVQAASESRADYRHRIFTVAGEIPFAGHPSLGTAFAVARQRGLGEGAPETLHQQVLAGVHPITVERSGDRGWASMVQGTVELGPAQSPGAALGALGLRSTAAHPELEACVASTGLPHLIVPLRSARALRRMRPDWTRLAALCRHAGCAGVYAFAFDESAQTARARSFPDITEQGEDPATGSAAGPLAGYLYERTGLGRWKISQGVEMGRPSTLVADATPRAGGIEVSVSGGVVLVIEGRASI